ncbi:hypothetical protein SDRG_13446 [Saprolegnia diclina VS20]|uniref:Cyclic nucleotide-binding domain-containing protein n=1 Tax=Saprolegnia diclina (strain VS20) TaxID=1156394 RepID=T0R9D9_SAPDV|nr:hypothetical protein SDRG_13446 [Saprolegnia diclina VS20]EQC28763.1 hypothetical protein SDRG_13446 [Saprolegnia diclina VS20]|eukprot:XP_008617758.1 hypothetical protein SDRG_13446 [Saprolegnia diclina VS20]
MRRDEYTVAPSVPAPSRRVYASTTTADGRASSSEPRRSSTICTDALVDRTASGKLAAPTAPGIAPPRRRQPVTRPSVGQRLLASVHKATVQRTLTAAFSTRRCNPNVLRQTIEELERGLQYKYVLHPLSNAKTTLDLISVALVVVYCWLAPLEMSFDWWHPPDGVTYFMLFLDAWFILDMLLRFRTGLVDCGVIIMNPRIITTHYIRSYWFYVDAFSSFPLEFFMPSDTATSASTRHSVKLMKYFKIPKLLRLGRLLKNVHRYRGYGGIVTVFGALFFVAHCAACIWVLLVGPCPDGSTDKLCANDQVMSVYLLAFHVAQSALLGGNLQALVNNDTVVDGAYRTGTTPLSLYVWAVVMQPLSAVFMALIFGNIIHLVQSVNRTGNAFRKKMDQVHHEMDSLNLPKHLRQRVSSYYDYLWLNNRNLSENMTLLSDEGMSLVLRRQIAIYLYKEQLLKIPFFQHATDDVLGMICMLLRQVVYMSGDYIFQEGDIGKELYMVVKGCVEVLPSAYPDPLTADAHTRLPHQETVLLGDGDFFGEIGLVMEVYRTRTVRAASMAELCILTKEGFNSVLGDFPEFAIEMKNLVVKRIALLYGQHNLSAETLARVTAVAERNLQKRINAYGSSRRKIERQAERALGGRDKHNLQHQLRGFVVPTSGEGETKTSDKNKQVDDDDVSSDADEKLVANKVWTIAKQLQTLKAETKLQNEALQRSMESVAATLSAMQRQLEILQPAPKSSSALG